MGGPLSVKVAPAGAGPIGPPPRWLAWGQVVVLPALLLLLTGAGLGFYYETNDDLTITQLLRGITAPAPVTDLHLYFHGLAGLLAGLYQQWPAVPWYGILLYGLLYWATALAFAVLAALLRGRLKAVYVTLALVLFYWLGWLEHAMWFNYGRVPLLLAATGLLYVAQRPTQRSALLLGVLAGSVAWLIRPSAAVLGAAAVGPAVVWLGGGRGVRLLTGAAVLAGVASLALLLTQREAAATYRRLDVLKSGLNDYQLYRPVPRTAHDRLGVRAVQAWQLGDSTLVNEALFRRSLVFEPAYFLTQVAPGKLVRTAAMLGRDYFPLLFLLLLSGWYGRWLRGRHGAFWGVQGAFVLLLFGLGTLLKLPPRLALPVLDCWLLTNLIYLGRQRGATRIPAGLLALLGVVGVLYGYKTLHRQTMLAAEARRGANAQVVWQAARHTLVITDALELNYKAQSPFHNQGDASARIMSVRGWQTLDPSQAALRQHLTGTRAYVTALQRLARRPPVRWYLTPDGAGLLNQQLAAAGARERLIPVAPARRLPARSGGQPGRPGGLPGRPDGQPGWYCPRVEMTK